MCSPWFHIQPTSVSDIYINDLSGDLLNAKQFETDTSLFSVVYNVNASADEVNNDSVKFNK